MASVYAFRSARKNNIKKLHFYQKNTVELQYFKH